MHHRYIARYTADPVNWEDEITMTHARRPGSQSFLNQLHFMEYLKKKLLISLEMYDKVEPDCLFANKLRAKELSVLPIVVTFATRQNRH